MYKLTELRGVGFYGCGTVYLQFVYHSLQVPSYKCLSKYIYVCSLTTKMTKPLNSVHQFTYMYMCTLFGDPLV